MASLRLSWKVQVRVIGALMLRELTTRFGRENIGFLWIMAEPLLFAVLVGLLWRAMKGPLDHGVDVIAFTTTGYIPLVLFRTSISRGVKSFSVNGGLMYHRQIKIFDLLLVRFLVEFIGHLMAYFFIGFVLGALGIFPWPYDVGFLILGGLYWSFFTFSAMLVVAAISEMSETVEKVIPVVTYVMIPFSGAFYLVSALAPQVANAVLYSPAVHAMEMMRYGVFGPSIDPHFDYLYPLEFSLVCMALGLMLCRIVRNRLVIE